MLESESVFGIIDAKAATDALGRFVPKAADDVLLLLDGQAGGLAIRRGFDAVLNGKVAEFAVRYAFASAVKAAGGLRIGLLQPFFLVLSEATKFGGRLKGLRSLRSMRLAKGSFITHRHFLHNLTDGDTAVHTGAATSFFATGLAGGAR